MTKEPQMAKHRTNRKGKTIPANDRARREAAKRESKRFRSKRDHVKKGLDTGKNR